MIIGNDNYLDIGQWPKLNTAVAGARELAKILEQEYNFSDVKVSVDATRREILWELDALFERSQELDSVLIYYAGHGYLREDTGEGFWVPVDAEGFNDFTFVHNLRVQTKIRAFSKRVQHVLLVADSCFSGALLRPIQRGVELSRSPTSYIEKVMKGRSVQIFAAGGLDTIDDEYGVSGLSHLTFFLVKFLRENSKKYLTASELIRSVTENVVVNSRHMPRNNSIENLVNDGEFVFVRDVDVEGRFDCVLFSWLIEALQECESYEDIKASPACSVFRILKALAQGNRKMAKLILGADLGLPRKSMDRVLPALDYILARHAIDSEASTSECHRRALSNVNKVLDSVGERERSLENSYEYKFLIGRCLGQTDVVQIESHLPPETSAALRLISLVDSRIESYSANGNIDLNNSLRSFGLLFIGAIYENLGMGRKAQVTFVLASDYARLSRSSEVSLYIDIVFALEQLRQGDVALLPPVLNSAVSDGSGSDTFLLGEMVDALPAREYSIGRDLLLVVSRWVASRQASGVDVYPLIRLHEALRYLLNGQLSKFSASLESVRKLFHDIGMRDIENEVSTALVSAYMMWSMSFFSFTFP